MKHVMIAALVVVLFFVLFAFYNVTFDISVWSADSRLLCALCMSSFGAFAFFASGMSDVT